MAIEFEKIKPWDGQSGTGADNRGVIDRNFEKVETELENVDLRFEDVEDEIAQLAGDINIYDASKKNQYYNSIEEVVASVPKEKRKRNLIIIYKSSSTESTMIQFYLGNPSDESTWLDSTYWREIESKDVNSVLTLPFDTDINTTRSKVNYYYRRKGQLIKYEYDGNTIVEEIQTNNKDGLYLEDSNFRKILNSEAVGFVNVSKKSYAPLSFEDAVNLIPVEDRVRNQVVSYMSDKGLVLMQLKQGDINASFTDKRMWHVLYSSEKTDIINLEFDTDPVTTRKKAGVEFRFKGKWFTYYDTSKNVRVVEEALTDRNSDEYFPRDENFRRIIPMNGGSDIEITNVVKEGKLNENKGTSRSLIHAPVGNIQSSDVITLPSPHNGVIRFGLHTSALQGDSFPDEFHFAGQCLPDFSDIRFTDRLDKPREHKIVHVLNGFDVVRNKGYKMFNIPLVDGRVVSSNTSYSVDADGVSITEDDGNTYTKLQSKTLIGVSKAGVIFSSGAGNDGNKLYRMPPNSDGSYTPNTETLVHTAIANETSISRQSFAEDSKGGLYCAKYQAEWDAEIFKSDDGGLTWRTIFQDNSFTHVHHIYIDDRDYIYVGLDGNRYSGYGLPECMFSIDFGATWEFLPIPFKNRDYGIVYTGLDAQGRRFGLGCGEANVHTGPTIYKTYDFENYYPVLNTLQGVRKIKRFGNKMFAGGNIGWGNRTGQIYMSEDFGETWGTIHLENWQDTKDVGAGLRFLTDAFVPKGSEKKQMIFHGYGGKGLKPVVIIEDGNESYAVCEVKVGNLSGLKVKHGYSIPYENTLIFDDVKNGLISDFKLDEGAGYYAEDYAKNKLAKIVGEFDWIHGNIKHFELTSPVDVRSRNGLKLESNSFIELDSDLVINNGLTLSFWANFKNEENFGFVWGDPSNIHAVIENRRLHIKNGSATIVSRDMTMWWGWDAWVKYCISISASGKSLYIYNGMYETAQNVTWTSGIVKKEYIGGAPTMQTCNFPLSGVKVYGRDLSYNEMLSDFLGYSPVTRDV